MKLLGFVLAGVVLGYLLGGIIGENRAAEDAGWLTFLILDEYRGLYASRGAFLGGVIGLIAWFLYDQNNKGSKDDRQK